MNAYWINAAIMRETKAANLYTLYNSGGDVPSSWWSAT
jgi:hypothetical protein